MEHLQHFGLNQDPFSNEPDLRFYFASTGHLDAQRRVERGVRQHKGLTLLTGDGGMGKTLLTRRILDGLEEEVFEAILLVMLPGAADAMGILQRFARQLGAEEPAPDRAALIGQIYEQLAIVREDGRHAVLMIDDAQIMEPEVLAELGGLLNLEYEDRRLLSMLLVGSPQLDRLVQNDPGIAPRVEVRVRLQPLEMRHTMAYIEHRLARVGGRPEIISSAALDALYKFGRGRPRLLNTLADNALFEAYLENRPAIDAGDVERAAADLGIGPDPGSTFVAPAVHAVMRPNVLDSLEDATTLESPSALRRPSSAPAPLVVPNLEGRSFATTEPEPSADLDLDLDLASDLVLSDSVSEASFDLEAANDAAELGSLGFGSEPLDLEMEDAEFSTDEDDEMLEGLFVELIDE